VVDINFVIDTSKDVKPISPYIYGVNPGTIFQDMASTNEWGDGKQDSVTKDLFTLARSGGNRLSAYNWENNASFAGIDFQNQNDGYLTVNWKWPWFEWQDDRANDPAGAIKLRIENMKNATTLITVPMLGYAAADKNGDGDVSGTADYINTRFKKVKARKNAPLSLTPDLNDDFVYQDEFVNWLTKTFPDKTFFYSMDNEPSLWASTHERIHPQAVTYEEIVNKNIEYASMVKDIDKNGVIFGYVGYGFYSFISLQGAPDAAGRDFLEHYLEEMQNAEQEHGKRLIDVLDFHWYPSGTGAGHRITEGGTSLEEIEARIQSPRSLFDTTYSEDSWIVNDFYSGGAIALLPRIKEKIATHYPGTKIAITEYFFGAESHISGGIAQADMLGVCAKEGVYAATLWDEGAENTMTSYIKSAFEAFRNYDGNGGTFGDSIVFSKSEDIEKGSIYGSVSTETGDVILIAINKSNSAQKTGFTLHHSSYLKKAKIYTFKENFHKITFNREIDITENAFIFEMPAYSVSTIFIKSEDTEPVITNPCDGITCSGFGICDAAGETCNCQDGYHADGFNCIKDEIAASNYIIIDHTSVILADTIPDEYLNAAKNYDVYLQHASVGHNIVDGLVSLKTNPRYDTEFTNSAWGANGATVEWYVNHNGIADNSIENPPTFEKIDIFNTTMRNNDFATHIDIAIMKLCYIDIWAGEPSELLKKYTDVMAALENDYKETRFVYFTMPLVWSQDSVSNSYRESYNNLLRAYCKDNNKVLFDFADIESHDPSGNLITNDDGIPSLYSEYTQDGGHLWPEGADRVARAFWVLMAKIDGWK